jgi:hypothetical protein
MREYSRARPHIELYAPRVKTASLLRFVLASVPARSSLPGKFATLTKQLLDFVLRRFRMVAADSQFRRLAGELVQTQRNTHSLSQVIAR